MPYKQIYIPSAQLTQAHPVRPAKSLIPSVSQLSVTREREEDPEAHARRLSRKCVRSFLLF